MSREYPCVYYDNEKCRKGSPEEGYVDWCVMGPCSHETPSNADRIRAMSDEELCEFLYSHKFCDICEEGCEECRYHGDCERRLADWLKQPVEEA